MTDIARPGRTQRNRHCTQTPDHSRSHTVSDTQQENPPDPQFSWNENCQTTITLAPFYRLRLTSVSMSSDSESILKC